MLQYYIGKSGWTDVTGGSSARNTEVCGFEPETFRDLWLRAVSDRGFGLKSIHSSIKTLKAGKFKQV